MFSYGKLHRELFDEIMSTGKFSTGDGEVIDFKAATPKEIEAGIAKRERLYRKDVRQQVWGFQTETQFEDAFCLWLSEGNIAYERQVHCDAGIIDVLTEGIVFELKHDVDREALIKAVGQVLLYTQAIGEWRKPFIVFTRFPNAELGGLLPLVHALGIEILEWTPDGNIRQFKGDDAE